MPVLHRSFSETCKIHCRKFFSACTYQPLSRFAICKIRDRGIKGISFEPQHRSAVSVTSKTIVSAAKSKRSAAMGETKSGQKLFSPQSRATMAFACPSKNQRNRLSFRKSLRIQRRPPLHAVGFSWFIMWEIW